MAEPTAWDFSFTTIDGKALPLAAFKGKAMLVVNTASKCGYTPQYRGLEALYKRYHDKGFFVLGVPCNDFGGQEPGTEAEIKAFCHTNFQVTFPLTAKVSVAGRDAHPFYDWARAKAGLGGAPKWNFHKYLIAPDGTLAGWFPTQTAPDAPALARAIEKALPAKG